MRPSLLPVLGALAALGVGRPWRPRPRSPAPGVRPSGSLTAWAWRLKAGFDARRRSRRTSRAVIRSLPDVVDLLLLGVGAGLSPQAVIDRCRPVLPEPFGAAIREAERRLGFGDRFGVALESALAPLGPRARPLLAALVAAQRDGTDMAARLRRVGDEARRRRRVEAQERARRLPVLLLLPLVFCVLPSFALLTLAPLVLASLEPLGLP